jgi:2-phosphoglycolate phosphatase
MMDNAGQVPRSLRAVFFDFDGTLVDSYPAITASVNHVRAFRGNEPLSVEEVRCFVGRGPVYLLENTVPGTEVEADLARYRSHHPTAMRSLTEMLPGALEVLTSLRQAGMLLGLCSNKPRGFSEQLLDHLRIRDHFAAVLGPEDVDRIKPAPDMLVQALHRLQVSKDESLYVGDMSVDILTARAAGVTVWVVPTGSENREVLEAARPDRLFSDLGELEEALELA